jgi:DNA-binding CsgD family transcriptional regulator
MVIAQRETAEPRENRGRRGATLRHDAAGIVRPDARVLAGETPSPGLRGEIVDSWRQSAAFGLRPDQLELPFDGCDGCDERLLRAATPVVERWGVDLASTEISVVLAGERCRIVDRRAAGPFEEARLNELTLSPGYLWGMEHAGMNGLSAAFVSGMPSLVHGAEHFADALANMATAGAPLQDPHTERILGALAFVCSTRAANQLLLPMVGRAAREVAQGLLDDSSDLDRLVQAKFLEARRRTRRPLAAVSRTTFLTNAAAARFLPGSDHSRLWDFVSRNLNVPAANVPRFTLAGGSALAVSLESILDGRLATGALVRFAASTDQVSLSQCPHPSKSLRPTFGWDSLTEAEHSVSELVAEGLTNRRVAARLFLSPHTVDSHLRHIFRKLDINSRVDLVRMVVARSTAQRPLVGVAHVA